MADCVTASPRTAPLTCAKASLRLDHGLIESAESVAMRAAVPVTPCPEASKRDAPSPASPAVCSPRDPASKLAAQLTLPAKVVPSANAANVVGNSSPVTTRRLQSPSNAASSPVSAPAIQSPPYVSTPTAANSGFQQHATLGVTTKRAAAAASMKASSPKATKANTGRWTEAEHKLFLKGLEQFPYRAWKKIATLIKTRTVVQIRTHAQKYYQKLEKEEQRMREREAQLAAQQGLATQHREASPPSTPAPAPVEATQPMSVTSPIEAIAEEDDMVGLGKKKAVVRKRKASTDEEFPQTSLPKRMMKEKRPLREKTMSPKQKTMLTNGKVFGFAEFGNDGWSSARVGAMPRSMNGIKSNPLDFDETSSSNLILDFSDEKPHAEYSFAMDAALDHGLTGIENDDLLQLTDEESLEWFSASGDGDSEDDQCVRKPTPVSSPLNLGRISFAPLYPEESLHFAEPAVLTASTTECSTPSPILASSADCSDFSLSGDEDDDFVLDPDKFLSSYFSPDSSEP
ncbi:hypothetical protein Poli38472_005605 [Pythium oligandrum]|uniref:Uncharacterized protein n=1 Tax=Pythium oligandrum TaxID=41045 RepID=A0A8K1FKM6_PYTOL|nr:hypothetical protein Poli38472_005605 [Pythium oligandrum]|eukprot:TMW62987.1 hypothetical protein Poli38472_005605 [Pythium oligandrum]